MIGAGVMGTSTAYHLALRGAGVLLLDKLGAAGGPSGASAGMLRAHYEDPAIVAVARYGCEFLADMRARTGSDPGFVKCGYLAVGEADREPRIRRAIAGDARRGRRRGGARQRRHPLAGAAAGRRLPDDRRLRAGKRRVRAALRGRRLCPGGSAPRSPARLRHARDGGAARRRRLPPALRRRPPHCGRPRGGLLRRLRPASHALSRRLASDRARARPSRPLPPAVPLRPSRPDRLPPLAGRLAASRRRRRPLPGRAHGPTSSAGAPIAHARDRAEPTSASSSASRASSRRVFPGAARGIFRGSWASWLDFTPDGNPVVDLLPRRPGLLLASGMSGHAFKLCPALGLGAAELLLDGEVSSFDWSPFRYGRFSRSAARSRGASGTGTG